MKKKSLGLPKTKSKTRESPNDYVRRLRETYKWAKNTPLSILMFWDKQDRQRDSQSK